MKDRHGREIRVTETQGLVEQPPIFVEKINIGETLPKRKKTILQRIKQWWSNLCN